MFIRIDGNGPIYYQIYSAIRKAIISGELTPGAQIPSSRQLSRDFTVSRNTVVLAYNQLMAEGYIESSIGSGMYVSAALPDGILRGRLDAPLPSDGEKAKASLSHSAAHALVGLELSIPVTAKSIQYDFQYGSPNLDDFPHELWRRLLINCTRQRGPQAMNYAPVQGLDELRVAVTEYVRRARGVTCDPENILIVNGSQQALDLIARTLLNPGDHVAIENPQYPGARHAFSSAGSTLIPVPVDSDGMIIDLGEKAVKDAKLIYVTPSHQFPTGGVMPQARREGLLDWADRMGAYVVEDDYDSQFRYTGRPIEAVQGLDRQGRVIYIGTMSKTMFPALRLGYLILPQPLVKPFTAMKYLSDKHSPPLFQQALTRFLNEGHFDRHVRRARVRNAARCEALLDALRTELGDQVQIEGGSSGLHLLLWFPSLGVDRISELVRSAARFGLGIYPVTPYYIGPPPMAGFILGYASLEEHQIRQGVSLLRKALMQLPGQ